MAVRPAIALLVLLTVLTGAFVVRRGGDSAIVATIAVGHNPIGVVADTGTGTAFVVNNGDDTISVLDTASATLRRTVGVGTGPTTVVLDQPRRRFVVTNTGWHALEQAGQIVAYGWDGTGSSSISVLDAASGRLLRTVSADVSVHGAIVDPQSWHAFIGATDFHDEGIKVLRMATHRPLPLSSVPGWPIAVASDQRAHRVVIVSEVNDPGATVSVFDTVSGQFVQYREIGSVFGRRTLAVDQQTGRTFIGTTTVSGGQGLRGAVDILDTRSGALLHTVALPNAPAAIAVDEQDSRVFVSTLGASNLSPPVRFGAGAVTTLDARTGAIVRSSTVGIAPGPLVVDPRHGRVLVATVGATDGSGNPAGPGAIAVLDARSGAVLRTVAVGIAPGDIALDEQAGRAFVLNFGGTVAASDPWAWLPQSLRNRLPFLPRQGGRTRTLRGSVTVLDTARL